MELEPDREAYKQYGRKTNAQNLSGCVMTAPEQKMHVPSTHHCSFTYYMDANTLHAS